MFSFQLDTPIGRVITTITIYSSNNNATFTIKTRLGNDNISVTNKSNYDAYNEAFHHI